MEIPPAARSGSSACHLTSPFQAASPRCHRGVPAGGRRLGPQLSAAPHPHCWWRLLSRHPSACWPGARSCRQHRRRQRAPAAHGWAAAAAAVQQRWAGQQRQRVAHAGSSGKPVSASQPGRCGWAPARLVLHGKPRTWLGLRRRRNRSRAPQHRRPGFIWLRPAGRRRWWLWLRWLERRRPALHVWRRRQRLWLWIHLGPLQQPARSSGQPCAGGRQPAAQRIPLPSGSQLWWQLWWHQPG